jgi:hypothetical protein
VVVFQVGDLKNYTFPKAYFGFKISCITDNDVQNMIQNFLIVDIATLVMQYLDLKSPLIPVQVSNLDYLSYTISSFPYIVRYDLTSNHMEISKRTGPFTLTDKSRIELYPDEIVLQNWIEERSSNKKIQTLENDIAILEKEKSKPKNKRENNRHGREITKQIKSIQLELKPFLDKLGSKPHVQIKSVCVAVSTESSFVIISDSFSKQLLFLNLDKSSIIPVLYRKNMYLPNTVSSKAPTTMSVTPSKSDPSIFDLIVSFDVESEIFHYQFHYISKSDTIELFYKRRFAFKSIHDFGFVTDILIKPTRDTPLKEDLFIVYISSSGGYLIIFDINDGKIITKAYNYHHKHHDSKLFFYKNYLVLSLSFNSTPFRLLSTITGETFMNHALINEQGLSELCDSNAKAISDDCNSTVTFSNCNMTIWNSGVRVFEPLFEINPFQNFKSIVEPHSFTCTFQKSNLSC